MPIRVSVSTTLQVGHESMKPHDRMCGGRVVLREIATGEHVDFDSVVGERSEGVEGENHVVGSVVTERRTDDRHPPGGVGVDRSCAEANAAMDRRCLDDDSAPVLGADTARRPRR